MMTINPINILCGKASPWNMHDIIQFDLPEGQSTETRYQKRIAGYCLGGWCDAYLLLIFLQNVFCVSALATFKLRKPSPIMRLVINFSDIKVLRKNIKQWLSRTNYEACLVSHIRIVIPSPEKLIPSRCNLFSLYTSSLLLVDHSAVTRPFINAR